MRRARRVYAQFNPSNGNPVAIMNLPCSCCGRFPLARFLTRDFRNKTEEELTTLFSADHPQSAITWEKAGPAYLFKGGTILTMDTAHPRVEALLIQGEKITHAGALVDLPNPLPHATEVIELGTQCLMPGFVDPHMHILGSAVDALLVDLRPKRFMSQEQEYNLAAVLQVLQEEVDQADPLTGWVLAAGFDSSQLTTWANLTAKVLDGLKNPHEIPIVVQAGSGHLTYVNSKVLELAQIDQNTPNPAGGYIAKYGQDNPDNEPVGALSGILVETPAQALLERAALARPTLPPNSVHFCQAIRNVMFNAVKVGNTLINEAALGTGVGFLAEMLLLKAIILAGGQPIRIASAMYLDEWEPASLPQGFTQGPDFTNKMFVCQAVKLFADGSNQGVTGLQTLPYSPWALKQTQSEYVGPYINGNADVSSQTLSSFIKRAVASNWQVMIHANGDGAIDNALAAYAAAGVGAKKDLRHRIEHCSILRDDQLKQMVNLGLSPSFLIAHTTVWGAVLKKLLNSEATPQRADLLDRCRSALDSGLRISLHTDYDVTPLGPLQLVQDAVTRTMQANGEPLNADECITVEQALKAVTIEAAWQCHMDDYVGSLKVGKLADLVILAQSPSSVAPDQIAGITVMQTWVGGQRVYAAAN
ncbi:MAG: amidohydrolase [Acetobacteraceae bacterium]|nr:amidohydrolase [Acetobacteraceae bacterium]